MKLGLQGHASFSLGVTIFGAAGLLMAGSGVTVAAEVNPSMAENWVVEVIPASPSESLASGAITQDPQVPTSRLKSLSQPPLSSRNTSLAARRQNLVAQQAATDPALVPVPRPVNGRSSATPNLPTPPLAETLPPVERSATSVLPLEPATQPQFQSQSPQTVAQTIDVGTPTQGGFSYIGVGGNIGISGTATDLGRSSFSVFSKIGLTRNLSVRPAAMFSQDVAITVPITYDFRLREAGTTEVDIAPYIGGGVAFTTGNNSQVAPMITAGVDIPVADRLTATAGVNVGFFNQNTDVGLLLGIGYTLPNF